MRRKAEIKRTKHVPRVHLWSKKRKNLVESRQARQKKCYDIKFKLEQLVCRHLTKIDDKQAGDDDSDSDILTLGELVQIKKWAT